MDGQHIKRAFQVAFHCAIWSDIKKVTETSHNWGLIKSTTNRNVNHQFSTGTVLSSIPWHYSHQLNQPTLPTKPQAKVPQPIPNPYPSIYYFLQTNQLQPVTHAPTPTIISTTAYRPALSAIFRVWNRIWRNRSYYPYRTTPQPTTSDKNLLRPP